MHNPDPLGIIAESPPLNDNLFTRELGYQVSLFMAEGLLKSELLNGADVES
jgi:hypothetical protein